MSATFMALNCVYGCFFFFFVCVLVVLLLEWVWGVNYCVCGGCAGWWTGGSEDRTSLRGVAVNPWPRWLSLQGGGGHPEVRLVQGHMMAGRGGGEVSNLVFVYEAFSPPPPSFLWEQSLRGRTMSKGSDLFYEPFKGDGGLSTKKRQRSSGELMNTMTHSHMFVYKMLLSCFDHHKWQFSSSEQHLDNVLSLCLITS